MLLIECISTSGLNASLKMSHRGMVLKAEQSILGKYSAILLKQLRREYVQGQITLESIFQACFIYGTHICRQSRAAQTINYFHFKIFVHCSKTTSGMNSKFVSISSSQGMLITMMCKETEGTLVLTLGLCWDYSWEVNIPKVPTPRR